MTSNIDQGVQICLSYTLSIVVAHYSFLLPIYVRQVGVSSNPHDVVFKADVEVLGSFTHVLGVIVVIVSYPVVRWEPKRAIVRRKLSLFIRGKKAKQWVGNRNNPEECKKAFKGPEKTICEQHYTDGPQQEIHKIVLSLFGIPQIRLCW